MSAQSATVASAASSWQCLCIDTAFISEESVLGDYGYRVGISNNK